jgi:kynurenine formamidase
MCVAGCEAAVRQALSRRGLLRAAGAAAAFSATAVSATAQTSPARHSFTRVVDLTHTMSAEFPTFSGEPGIEMERKDSFAKDRFNLFWWHIIEHDGTHLDAPIHFSENGATVDRIAASDLVVPLAVVDVSAKAARDPDYQLSRDDLATWERHYGRLPAGACVAMNSGWAKYATDPARFTGRDVNGTLHFPGIHPDATAWLLKERRVSGLAVDTLSLDNGVSKDFQTHYLWLPGGHWGLENVANLDAVPPAGAMLVVGVAKVKDATGGPTRLFALV